MTDKKHRLAWPSPFFAPRWYSRKFGLTDLSANPLLQFLLSYDENSPHPLLDVKFLKDQSSSWRSDAVALEFLVDRDKHRLKPHPLFDSIWYLERNPDVSEANINPLEHYLYFGHIEGRNPNRFFSVSWYNNEYIHFSYKRGISRIEPLTHYVSTGCMRGCIPSPGLKALRKTSIKVTEHGPAPYAESVIHGKNLYASLGHQPTVRNGTFSKYMKYSIHDHNPFFPEHTLLLRRDRVAVMYSPKCGSLTIVNWWLEQIGLLECALRFSEWSHDFENIFRSSREYIDGALGFDPQRYKSYKFVRNPLFRAVSSFVHLLAHPASFGVSRNKNGISFVQFLHQLRVTDYMGRELHVRPQLTRAEEEGYVSPTIFKIEDGLDVQLRLIESRHGLVRANFESVPALGKVLLSNKKQSRSTISVGPEVGIPFGAVPNYRALLTAETMKEIYLLYRGDFEAYGYRAEHKAADNKDMETNKADCMTARNRL